MSNGVITRVMAFAKQPFNPQGDAVNWALFFILAVTVAFAWTKVLHRITASVAEEI